MFTFKKKEVQEKVTRAVAKQLFSKFAYLLTIFAIINTSLLSGCSDEATTDSLTSISKHGGTASHNAHTNRDGVRCALCHVNVTSGNQPYFTISGTVYDYQFSTNTRTPTHNSDNVTVRLYNSPNINQTPAMEIEVDALGNFYTTQIPPWTTALSNNPTTGVLAGEEVFYVSIYDPLYNGGANTPMIQAIKKPNISDTQANIISCNSSNCHVLNDQNFPQILSYSP